MEKLCFEFTLLPGRDAKSNMVHVTSITTMDKKLYKIPEERQAISHHVELMKKNNYSKVKNSLAKRNQIRRVCITMTERLEEIYIDGANVQFEG
ncbi:hypothetical protein M0802_015945, partial [Mischocyttarus mexicanus]